MYNVNREAALYSLIEVLEQFLKHLSLSGATRNCRDLCPVSSFFGLMDDNSELQAQVPFW